jgi:23S rRNA (cytosine1962-C5)-methyltransferase
MKFKPRQSDAVRRRAERKPARIAAPATSRETAVSALNEALRVRADLLADAGTNCCRLFNDAADGIPGFVLERFGDVLIAQCHQGRLGLGEPAVRNLCAQAMERTHARAVYRKVFAQERSTALPQLEALHQDATPWLGTPIEEEFPVRENGMAFLIRPYDGYSTGLFMEHRDNRQRIRELARGKTVLNTFAYTCGFSVAAALGGAEQVVSVDVSKKYLDWGERNFQVNTLNPAPHLVIRSDVFDYLGRARRQGRRFDLIILDPPTFGRAKRPKRVFSITEDLDRLTEEAVELLSPGGHVLLATNHRGTARRRLEQALAAAARGGRVESVACPALPADFRGDPDYAKFVLCRLA